MATYWGVDVSTRALHAVAIDAPSGWSEGRHLDDGDLPPKFRTARCGEIALRADHGYAVPWPTPAGPGERTAWMEVGIAVHGRLVRVTRTVEVFPHAAFLHLAGERRLPRKSSHAGARRRAELLAGHVEVDADELARWSVDHRDALAAAVTARDVAEGRAGIAACAAHPEATPIHLPAASSG